MECERMEESWPDFVSSILKTLQNSGFEAFMVGGCVRDRWLGRTVSDFDVTTNATPEQVMTLFPKTVATGIRHGTVTVFYEGHPVEITTYRVDLAYRDGRHPQQVRFTPSLVEDLARRDFTINAMAQDLQGHWVDPYQGRIDLANRVIRCVGSPYIRFQEDALRILRALRLATELEFHIEETTFLAMLATAPLLTKLSGERVGQELWRLAGARNWFLELQFLANPAFWKPLGVPFLALQPGLATLARREDVHQASWLTSVPENPDDPQKRALAGLATWLWIGQQSPETAIALVRRCGWPKVIGNKLGKTLAFMQEDPAQWSMLTWRKRLYDGPRDALSLACRVMDWSSGMDSNGPESRWHRYQEFWHNHPLPASQFLTIKGEDLIQLGLRGQTIGRMKETLVMEILSGLSPNRREDLLARAQEISQTLVVAQNQEPE